MVDKIDEALTYYNFKKKELLDFFNAKEDLNVEEIIEKAEALSILEYKIT